MGVKSPNEQSLPSSAAAPKRPFGFFIANGETRFRFFSPRARRVLIEIFDTYEQERGQRFDMSRNDDGTWGYRAKGDLTGKYYGYRVIPPNRPARPFMITGELLADPWSTYVTSANHHVQKAKTWIHPVDKFDWEGDTFIAPDDPRDLIIYEAHVKDMTAHPSLKNPDAGSYKGFLEPVKTSGLSHLKRLGVNAVELLPLQKAARFEPPYMTATPEGQLNTWNYYGRNHWGYMTTFFLAPETYYASDADQGWGKTIGKTTKAADELKTLVKTLHKEGISVIMDVVYNHVSQYDVNPLKYADADYYLRTDDKGRFKSFSGCGNDFRTEAPHARELILASIEHWMREYHIDGFRFDLALLIDWETMEAIRDRARAINPNVILIAEPWFLGGYDPAGYSNRDIAAWNDKFRNGVKGSNPMASCGYIFGKWHSGVARGDLQNYLMGTLQSPGTHFNVSGTYKTSAHALNYLECHDNLTLGDFIRLCLNPDIEDTQFESKKEITKLNEEELRISRLAALYLFVSQGITMVHAGQEWARSKTIAPSPINDPRTGCIDSNSYEKDNETNYLDYNEIEWNKELFEYYQGLIALRKSSLAMRRCSSECINFYDFTDALHLTYYLNGTGSKDPFDYFITLNGNRNSSQSIILPDGEWEMMVSPEKASPQAIGKRRDKVEVPASSGFVFRKLRDSR
ncbi:MAG TPA: alpha-amylase family glycosyl hydrolase [Balneolales bacterium]|nr:alpha-amylase family glycosyl hydrolase [Balneolales bacterium]